MADPQPQAANPAEDLVRRLVDANVKYYQAWGAVVTDWLTELADVARTAPQTVTLRTPTSTSPRPPSGHTHGPGPAAAAEPGGSVAGPGGLVAEAGAAVLVLEGPAGTQAGGAFEVENVLADRAQAKVVVDPFRAPDGTPLDVDVVVEPVALDLAPGESVVVSLGVRVPHAAQVDVDHHSTVRVEGIPAGTIAVVLRRTAS